MKHVWTKGLYKVTNQVEGAIRGGSVLVGLVTPHFDNEAMFLICTQATASVPRDTAEILRRHAEFTCIGGLPKYLTRECLRTGSADYNPMDGCFLRSDQHNVVFFWTMSQLTCGPMAPPPPGRFPDRYKRSIKLPKDKVIEFLNS